MGNIGSTRNKATQTRSVESYKFRNPLYNLRKDRFHYVTRYRNTKATQTDDEFTVKKMIQLKNWSLEKKDVPLCSKCLTCNCTYDCSSLNTEDITKLFKMLRITKDRYKQFKFLGQLIKLDPNRFMAQFYVRIYRGGNWAIRRVCTDSFRHIFRISSFELSELIKRIAEVIKERRNSNDNSDDSDCEEEFKDPYRQGYITKHRTVSKTQVRREVRDKWFQPSFSLKFEDLWFLDCYGFANCYCNEFRTTGHYLFNCPKFSYTRQELLNERTVKDLYSNERDFTAYIENFVHSATYSP